MKQKKHVWINNGISIGQIVLAKTAQEHERYAAEELVKYFFKISGTQPDIVQGIKRIKTPSIIIVDASRPANAKYLKNLPLSKLIHDGYIIKSDGKNIIITSKEPFGIVHGVYQYLKKVLGVIFHDYAPHGEEIPCSATISHKIVDILKNPKLSYRAMQLTYDLRRLDWMVKNGFNYTHIGSQKKPLAWWDKVLSKMSPELQKRGIKLCFGHHVFPMILPEKFYLEDNPEYFPVVNGKRGGQKQFYWSLRNWKKVSLEVIYVLKDFISRHPEIAIMDFIPADGVAKLSEKDYQAVTGEKKLQRGNWEKSVRGTTPTARLGDPNMAKIYSVMISEVAKELKKTFPELKMTYAAYATYIQPSRDLILPDNVNPCLAIYWRCIKHDLMDDQCVYNRQFKQVIKEWSQMYKGRDIFLFEYYSGVTNLLSLPYPCVTSMFREWKNLFRLGITGTKVHTGRIADTSTVPYFVNFLAFQSIVWGDTTSPEEFFKEYCRQFFGDAWGPICKMYLLWEKGSENGAHTQPGVGFFHNIFDRKTINESIKLLDTARDISHDPKVSFRIFRLKMLLEYSLKALKLSRLIMKRYELQRKNDSTRKVDNKMLNDLKDIVKYVRHMQELDFDIFGYIKAADFLPDDVVPEATDNYWKKLLTDIMKSGFDVDEDDPDVFGHGY